ncbi:unnamed protein product [Owenia fusiformis]|uniref:Uncharacterized protein n=1 Tax=Owenia fusiformis TaxID=6347 RepID=A0A8J1UFM6_OWEFU|nr:unnamed protein product [Owenia fusiformis]
MTELKNININSRTFVTDINEGTHTKHGEISSSQVPHGNGSEDEFIFGGNENDATKDNCVTNPMIYGIEDKTPIHLAIIYGLQQVLLSLSATIAIPLLISRNICARDEDVNDVTVKILGTFLVTCGIATFLQSTFGVRLPIIQGGCHSYMVPFFSLMSLEKWKCPELNNSTVSAGYNITPMVNMTSAMDNATLAMNNVTSTAFDSASDYDSDEVWKARIRELQGGIMLASVTQVVIGMTGLFGVILSFVGPLTVVPTVSLIGISLADIAVENNKQQWGIALLTIGLIILFSLFLKDIQLPVPAYNKEKKCHTKKLNIFKTLSIIIAIGLSWSVCAILTATNALPETEGKIGYRARTDTKLSLLKTAPWIFIPYPGQWGTPTVSLASYVGMMAATLQSIIESVGDYYACARVCAVCPPPAHAVNRGIAMEGLSSIICGAYGSGGATTSYSQDIGAIGFTRVASRLTFQMAGLIFILCGIFGKFGAVLTMMPDPVVGGIVTVSFGMVISVGLSNLQFVQLNSTRNQCILGLSFMMGIVIPRWLYQSPGAIRTGNTELDQALLVLLKTAMFVGGVTGFILDNIVPGSEEERGIRGWREHTIAEDGVNVMDKTIEVYDLPWITPFLKRHAPRWIPFLPSFGGYPTCRRCRRKANTRLC